MNSPHSISVRIGQPFESPIWNTSEYPAYQNAAGGSACEFADHTSLPFTALFEHCANANSNLDAVWIQLSLRTVRLH
jgi:hypothetical protein